KEFDLLILNLTRSDLHLTLLFRFHFRETRSLVVQFSKINFVLTRYRRFIGNFYNISRFFLNSKHFF
ncbi:hypothetical protein, partial [Paenibacillus woosongensis]|uniref:hypothetical protein n=1 Tax=Paenibacillus woosongensis TaxID=307580 RepID=UPI001BCB43D7